MATISVEMYYHIEISEQKIIFTNNHTLFIHASCNGGWGFSIFLVGIFLPPLFSLCIYVYIQSNVQACADDQPVKPCFLYWPRCTRGWNWLSPHIGSTILAYMGDEARLIQGQGSYITKQCWLSIWL